MNRAFLIFGIVGMLLPVCVKAGIQTDTVLIRSVEIAGQRPVKQTGVRQTDIPQRVLHDNIASQLSDALKFGSSVYVKEYGRATLSTVAFRGTSSSHTQVLWNGMRLNSPMLGMVDFSTIPSWLVDNASLLHGTSSVNLTGGGLGGAVILSTGPADVHGFKLQYVQGVGMFHTFDEYLRLGWGNDKWQVSTRAVLSYSKNDFKFRNYRNKQNTYDDRFNIVDSRYPVERNRSGDFRDLHVVQEAYYDAGRWGKAGLSAWYSDSDRGVPMLGSDKRNSEEYFHRMHDRTFRGVLSWDMSRRRYKIGAKAGYTHTSFKYDYKQDRGNGVWANMIRSRSTVNTLFGSAEGEYYLGKKWLFTGSISLHQHFVDSADRSVIDREGQTKILGYEQARAELSGVVSAKWRPSERLSFSMVLREDMFGTMWTPVIPAVFTDYIVSRRGNIILKGSVSRNFRFPTLNDLYCQPGGNPDLKSERGFTYDLGAEFTVGRKGRYTIHGEVSWFDSRIDNWIDWVPLNSSTLSTPVNIDRVHAYGIELAGALDVRLGGDWYMNLNGNFSWTPSIDLGKPVSAADESKEKQLDYIPEFSSSVTGSLTFRTWSFDYKWCYYSERFTTSSNNTSTKIGRVQPYYMSDVSLEKRFGFGWADLSLKCAVRNLFDEEYESVLSRPMPGINFEIFVGITPKW